MPRACTICTHPERHAIDKSLAAGATMRDLAAKYRVSPDAMERHNAAHIAARVARAAEAEEVRAGLDIVGELKAINATCLKILAGARNAGDADMALRASATILKQLEFQARLLGELDDRPQVNVLVSPEWAGVRQALLVALVPYPDARTAAAAALAQVEAPA
jgi:hypothetical protein